MNTTTPASDLRARAWAAIVIASALATALHALRYLVLGVDAVRTLGSIDAILAKLGDPSRFFTRFAAVQSPRYHALPGVVLAHVIPMSLALALGGFQFLPRLRDRWPAVHRRVGYVYAVSAITGGGFGSFLAIGAPMYGDRPTVMMNVAAGGLAAVFTILGVRAALHGDRVAHSAWMLRSFAAVMTIVTLYLLVPVFVLLRAQTEHAYAMSHYLCVPLNLGLVEIWIRWRRAASRGLLAHPVAGPTRNSRAPSA